MATPIKKDLPARVAAPAAAVRKVSPAPGAVVRQLPMEESAPSVCLEDQTFLIYGAKKVGKTSLACQFPGALLFAFEPASRTVRARRADCPRWADFLGYIDQMEKKAHGAKTVVIDTGFEAYGRCLEHVCAREGIEHPHDRNDYGKTWKMVGDEFRKAHIRLSALGLGLVVLCHEKMKENETRAGQKFDTLIPNLSGQADDYYRSVVDNLVHFHYRNQQRFLTLRGSDYIMAGVGSPEHWKTPKGEPVYAVPAGSSPAQAFQNLKSAFENKQPQSFKDETEKFVEEGIAAGVRRHLSKKKSNQ
mgnify:CR=1 FL=1